MQSKPKQAIHLQILKNSLASLTYEIVQKTKLEYQPPFKLSRDHNSI